ncbi:hypothetical protein JIN85_17055 [Luteolibacter pohnpeiensis]|uniref:Uncharacterized protein n=1 Tax=Luteolibacter pohnpeiensis TaxID=454153 RepID=A0A934S8J8_9BACT|nr:hypothetical protein [Luteolibacter pohnpeiensis]MBK1884132.1 hypothetical protein [Luteolibacter pohnpeiensis]
MSEILDNLTFWLIAAVALGTGSFITMIVFRFHIIPERYVARHAGDAPTIALPIAVESPLDQQPIRRRNDAPVITLSIAAAPPLPDNGLRRVHSSNQSSHDANH